MKDNLEFSPNALVVLKKRYLKKNEEGQAIETPHEMLSRVAKTVVSVERRYGASWGVIKEIEEEFFKMMVRLEFMPNSPTLMNAGKDLGQLSACFVVPVEDSMESIFDAIKATALIHKTGGGTGFSFSKLRPKSSMVKSTGGVASGPVSFMKVFDAATQAVKQGGTRRGANMGILRIDHPDILEFIKCKEKEGEISNFNISVAITEEFMEKVFKSENYNFVDPYSKEVRERVNAKEVFDLIAENAWKNGEPGIVFIDRINQSNPTSHLGDIESTNPCVTADTWIMTKNGPRRVLELIDKKFTAVVDGNPFEATDEGFFRTGFKPVYRLKTKEGFQIRVTLDHPFIRVNPVRERSSLTACADSGFKPPSASSGNDHRLKSVAFSNGVKHKTRERTEGEWMSLDQLSKGDIIMLHNHRSLEGWPGLYCFSEGYLAGLLLGDGTLKKDKTILSSWEKDEGADTVRKQALRIAQEFPHRKDFKGWTKIAERGECRLSFGYLKNICVDLGLAVGSKKITEEIEKTSSSFYKGFLQGLFDSDSSVHGDQNKGVSVRLAQSNLELLKCVQRMLLRLGIFSKIYPYRRKENMKNMPDGKGGLKEYFIKAQHELIISEENLLIFAQGVGFTHESKKRRLEEALQNYRRKINREFFLATVEDVTFDGMEDVYDVQVPGVNIFDANGFKVHNCGEQPLLPYESCNLGSLNLAKMLKTSGRGFEIDWDNLAKITRLSTRFLDNVIDANKFPLPQIKERTQQTRKIGLGIMGWATLLGYLGIPYEGEEALNLAKKVMEFIYENAKETSILLARERGVFPQWKGSIWEERGVRLRNATLTTIAPTGSISLIAGPTSTGVEPFFSLAYFRNILDGEKLLDVEPSFEYAAKERGFYSQELMKKIAEGESIQNMDVIPDDVKKVFKTALEIKPLTHVKMQAAFQEYTDNAVSKTINLPHDATVNDVKEAYIYAYKMGCKGITVYRDGSRIVQVLTVDKKLEEKEKVYEKPAVIAQPKPRPEVMVGTTTKITTGCGNLYVTVNQDEEGDFFEVFTEMGKAGGCAASQLEAVGRLISLAMRGGVDTKVIIEQLKGIRCPSPNWMNGQKIFSCADAIAHVLEKRAADQRQFVRLKLVKPEKELVKLGVLQSSEKSAHLNNIVGVCPDCGSVLRHQEGCAVCDSCGYSKC